MSSKPEIERRWLLPKCPDLSRCQNDGPIPFARIEQGYLDTPGYLRVRKRIFETMEYARVEVGAFLTRKIGKGLSRQEIDLAINTDIADLLLESTPYRVQKRRYVFGRFELDIFEGALEGLVLLECELQNIDEVVMLPKWAEDAIEITHTLDNFMLARMVPAVAQQLISAQRLPQSPPVIVLTGAPCSGKSTILSELAKDPTLHCVPEVATILLSQVGVSHAVGSEMFQRTMFRVQRAFEEAAVMSAALSGKRAVILDRGTLDGAAFVKGGWREYERLLGINAKEEAERYARVVYLDVVDEETYQQFGKLNAARRETWAEAAKVGANLYMIWSHLRPDLDATLLDGADTLQDKMNLVQSSIVQATKGTQS